MRSGPRTKAPGSGRARGTKNRATIEKERIAAEIAARTVADARVAGRKLGKDILDDFANLFYSMAAKFQANLPNDEDKFLRYAGLAVDCAHKLAPFQSPTFRAVAIVAPAPQDVRPGAVIDNVIPLNDPIATARVYRRLVSASRKVS